MDSNYGNLKFDLASSSDKTPTEDDDKIRKEIGLRSNQTLVSKIYKLHWRPDVENPATDVIVPVSATDDDVTGNNSMYFLLRWKGEWRKEMAGSMENGKIHAHLKEVDAFAVVLEKNPDNVPKVETMTIGPEGGKFVSRKDERISVDIPEGALEETIDFRFKACLVDRERYEEYMKVSREFQCVQAFSHSLGISPEVSLNKPVHVSLPLEGAPKGDNSKVVFVQWKKDKDGEKVAKVVDEHVTSDADNRFTTKVEKTTSSRYAPVRVPEDVPEDRVSTSMEFLSGRRSLCNILTFQSYERKHKLNRLLLDCVDFYKVNEVVDLHKMEGMEEVGKSRSRDIEMRKKTRIKISLEGNLDFFHKDVKVNSLLYEGHARTNKVVIPVTSTGEKTWSVVRYSWAKETHQVFFFLDKEKEKKKSAKAKVKPVQSTDISVGERSSFQTSGRTASCLVVNANNANWSSRTNAGESNVSVISSVKRSTDKKHSVQKNTLLQSSKATNNVESKGCQSKNSKDNQSNVNSMVESGLKHAQSTEHQPEISYCPLLTDKSLSALSDSLPQTVWRGVGLELNLSNDRISAIFETADRKRSDPRFELLKEWRNACSHDNRVGEILDALCEIGRNDIVEVLDKVKEQNREIRRSDFDVGISTRISDRTSKQKSNSLSHSQYKRPGEFIFPDDL